MQKYTMIRMLQVAVSSWAIGCIGVLAELTSDGLLVNLEAGNNSLSDNVPLQWENLGSLGGFVPQGGNAIPGFGVDESLAAWYSFDGTFRGVGEASFGKRGASGAPVLNIDSFSIEVWARRLGDKPPDPHSEHHFLQIKDFSSGQTFFVGLVSGETPGLQDTFSFDFIDEMGSRENGSTGYVMEKGTIFSDFHQYVFVFNNNNGGFDLWVDGGASPVFAVNIYPMLSSGSSMEFFIAGIHNEVGRRFQGDINTFRVYDRALTQEEIASNFAHGVSLGETPSPLPVVESNLITIPKGVEIAFDSEEGKGYSLQVAPNLLDGTWTDVGPGLIGNGGTMLTYHPTDGQEVTESLRIIRK